MLLEWNVVKYLVGVFHNSEVLTGALITSKYMELDISSN